MIGKSILLSMLILPNLAWGTQVEFFEGLGEATSPSRGRAISLARDEARAEIAKAIKSRVNSKSTKRVSASLYSSDERHGLNEVVARSFSSEHAIIATADFVTEVHTVSEEYDPNLGRARVKMRLNRQDWLKKYKPKVLEIGERVSALLASSGSSNSQLARIRLLRNALEVLNQNVPLIEAYDAIRFLDDQNFPVSSDLVGGSVNSVFGQIIRESGKLDFSVRVEGALDWRDRISKALMDSGLRVTKSGSVIIFVKEHKVRVEDPRLTKLALHSQSRRLDVVVREGDEDFAFELQVTEAAESEQLAETRVLEGMKREIQLNFVSRMFSSI